MIWRPIKLLVILVVLIGAGWARAASWQTAETSEFVVIGDAKPARIADVLESIEVYRYITSRFAILRKSAPYKSRVFVLSPEAFRRYTRARDNIAGFVKPNDYETDIVIESRDSNAWLSNQQVIQHELTHYYLRLNARAALPVWYDEGFAEFFSTVSFKGRKARIGDVPVVRLFALRNRPWLAMDRVFSVDRSSPEYSSHQLGESLYAQSWLVVHYMLLKEPSLAPAFEKMIMQQGSGLDASQALQLSLGDRVATLNDELRRYAMGSAWPYRYFDRPTESLQSAKLRPMEPEAVGAEIGGLLLRLNRFSTEELQTEINKLLPEVRSADGAAIKALANMRVGHASGVGPLVEQCAAKASGVRSLRICAQSWLARADNSSGAEERNLYQQRAATLVERALQIDALDIASMALLLRIRNALGARVDDLFAVSEQALDKLPSSFSLRITLAQAYFQSGEFESTKRHLEYAVLYDTEVQRRNFALGLLRDVENVMFENAKR